MVDTKNYNSQILKLLRVDKPVGTLLCLYPALFSLVLGSQTLSQLVYYTLICIIGAFLVRSFGCLINDYLDSNFDKNVERTKDRPLAKGFITNYELLITASALVACIAIVLFLIPRNAMLVAIYISPLLVIYPLTKRFTYFAQVFLGLIFNIGAIIAWNMVATYPIIIPSLIYITCILWTVIYDTIYGHQDRVYDEAQNLKSLSILWGEQTNKYIWYISQIMIVMLLLIGINASLGLTYYLSVFIAGYILYWQKDTLDINDPKDCGLKFRSSVFVGAVILIGMVLGRFLI